MGRAALRRSAARAARSPNVFRSITSETARERSSHSSVRSLPWSAAPRAPRGLERRDLALDRAEHLADRDLAGRPGQMVPARRATLGGQEARALELEQHLLQVALRNRLPRRDLLDRDEAARLAHR